MVFGPGSKHFEFRSLQWCCRRSDRIWCRLLLEVMDQDGWHSEKEGPKNVYKECGGLTCSMVNPKMTFYRGNHFRISIGFHQQLGRESQKNRQKSIRHFRCGQKTYSLQLPYIFAIFYVWRIHFLSSMMWFPMSDRCSLRRLISGDITCFHAVPTIYVAHWSVEGDGPKWCQLMCWCVLFFYRPATACCMPVIKKNLGLRGV